MGQARRGVDGRGAGHSRQFQDTPATAPLKPAALLHPGRAQGTPGARTSRRWERWVPSREALASGWNASVLLLLFFFPNLFLQEFAVCLLLARKHLPAAQLGSTASDVQRPPWQAWCPHVTARWHLLRAPRSSGAALEFGDSAGTCSQGSWRGERLTAARGTSGTRPPGD